MTNTQERIKEKADEKEIPVRLVVYDLEGNLMGYKKDSCWSLSKNPERYKIHPFRDTKPSAHLAHNLLYCFNRYDPKKTEFRDSWVGEHLEGVVVSVQEVSESNFGKELLRYRIIKKKKEYVVVSD